MASVGGAVPDESTADDGVYECSVAEESQIDERRGWRVTIRNVDVECVRDQMMSLKQKRFHKFQSITKNMLEIKSFTLQIIHFSTRGLKFSIFRINFLLILTSF